jgi:hypothetical protein
MCAGVFDETGSAFVIWLNNRDKNMYTLCCSRDSAVYDPPVSPLGAALGIGELHHPRIKSINPNTEPGDLRPDFPPDQQEDGRQVIFITDQYVVPTMYTIPFIFSQNEDEVQQVLNCQNKVSLLQTFACSKEVTSYIGCLMEQGI